MTDSDAQPDDAGGSGWRRWLRIPVQAARWFADTFRGYAGVREMKQQKK